MNIGPAEILVILTVALLVFGPQRLPEVGRQIGSAMRELRKMQDTVRGELDSVLHPDIGPDIGPAHDEPQHHEPPAEPGDHTAIATFTGSAEITGPDDDDATASPGAEDETVEADSRFSGPSDSFT